MQNTQGGMEMTLLPMAANLRAVVVGGKTSRRSNARVKGVMEMAITAAARTNVRPDTPARTHKASATLCSLQLALSEHTNRATAAYSAATTILLSHTACGRQIRRAHIFRTVTARAVVVSYILWIASTICVSLPEQGLVVAFRADLQPRDISHPAMPVSPRSATSCRCPRCTTPTARVPSPALLACTIQLVFATFVGIGLFHSLRYRSDFSAAHMLVRCRNSHITILGVVRRLAR